MRVVLVAGLLAAAGAAQAQAQAPVQGPGCAVGAAQTGRPAAFSAFGLADLEHGAPITPDSVFEAGSVSKQFTAAAILTLAQEGRIGLDDDIRRYLPEMPDYGTPITVDQLLTHTSGLRDWGELYEIAGWPRGSRVYGNAEAVALLARQAGLNYAPGSAYAYTNSGYNLAAEIVARVSGQSFAAFTRDRFFRPLGMTHTRWRDDFARVEPGRALAYEPAGQGRRLAMPFENTHGHGGLLTTVGDLLIWNQALAAGRIGPAVVEGMQRRARLTDGREIGYGRGLFVTAYRGVREFSHAGATAGYRAWAGRFPDQGLSIAVLCNGADIDAGRQALGLADARLTFPPASPAPAASGPTPAADLAALPGLYVQDGPWAQLWIAAEAGRLRVANGPPLVPLGPGRYAFWSEILEFRADGTLLRRAPDGQVGLYRKAAHVPAPSQAELEAVVGDYVSDELEATLEVRLRDGALTLAPADRPSAAVRLGPLIRDGFTYRRGLLRVLRGPGGAVTGLSYQGVRVWSLILRRVS